MKKKFLYSSLATTVIASATAISGVLLSNKLMYIKQKDADFIVERETKAKRFNKEWFDNCPKETLTIQSPNGYEVKGIFLKPLPTANTMIICHGVTENKMNSIKYAPMFMQFGYNTVVYDHRRHGESGGKTTSYGYYEKFDLEAIVEMVRDQIGPDALLGIHGESMGAATTLLYAGTIADEADFYIADSAFSDFRELLNLIVKNSISIRLKLAVAITDLTLRLRDGYWIKNVLPLEAVSRIDKPVLFLHNIHDTFIPATMTEELFEAKPDKKMLQLFEIGDHAQGYNQNTALYEQTIQQFLQTFVQIQPKENSS